MSNSPNFIPTVAIVGKPNVGKSSLFNRLIKRRKAIVSEEPGVTRDINYEILIWNGLKCRLADSAGFYKGGDELHSLTQALNRKLIDKASLIIFTCEITSLTGDDFDISDTIRKSGKPHILVVNKADNEKLLDNLYDFFDLGLEDPLPVSAEHGKNIILLKEKISEKLQLITACGMKSSDKSGLKTPDSEIIIDVAIVGKPNVGKSSLLNLLVNMERSLVTDTPGTTRDAIDENIEYNGYNIKLIDTAGLRKRSKIRGNIEFYSLVRVEKAIKKSTVSILLIDAGAGITTQDKKIAALIIKEKKGLIIAANKWDIAKEKGVDQFEFINDFYYFFPHISFAEIVLISAKTGYNKIKLLKNILTVYNNYNNKVKTNDFNTLLRKFSLKGDRIKYGFQRSAAPPVFEVFTGKYEHNMNFKRFIMNNIRKSFDFTGVPIEIIFKKG